jgi:hypothetical protein
VVVVLVNRFRSDGVIALVVVVVAVVLVVDNDNDKSRTCIFCFELERGLVADSIFEDDDDDDMVVVGKAMISFCSISIALGLMVQ